MGSITDLQIPGTTPQAVIAQRLKALEESINELKTRVQLTPPGSGPAGPAGPTGPTGATGATGPAGAAGAAGAPKTIQDEGVSLTQRDKLNFIGPGVSAVDNPTTQATDVTINATGSGGSGADAPIIQTFSATGSVTINGLDGDTDEFYELIVLANNSAVQNLYLQVNGDATLANYGELFGYDDSGGTRAISGGSSWPGVIISSNGVGTRHLTRVVIAAKGSVKQIMAHGGGEASRTWTLSGNYASATNLTSIKILPASGTFTGTVILRRLKSPATVLGGPKIVRGVVNADGSIASGTGFTVVKNATGDYSVTYTEAFAPNRPALTFSNREGTAVGIKGYGATLGTYELPTGFRVLTHNGSGTAVDGGFDFTAIDTNGAAVKYDNNVIQSGPRIVRGSVATAGGITRGTGFTISKGATGVYVINFTTPFVQAPVVTVSAQSWAAIALETGRTGSAVTISTFNTTNGVAADMGFDFEAVDVSSAGVTSWAAPTRVTTLPSGQPDGTVVYLQPDSSGQPGVLWQMRYDATAAKWDGIGGPDLLNQADVQNTISATSYAALPTAPVSVVVPVAGEYEIVLSGTADAASPTGSGQLYVTPVGAGLAANSVNALMWRSDNFNTGQRTVRRTLTAGTLALQAQVVNGNARLFACSLGIRPIRVG